MSKLHIISDLYLGFNENSDTDEFIPPETDLVIFNGNISKSIKRSFLYMEKLARSHPDVQFVVNLGEKEIYSSIEKYVNELTNNIKARSISNPTWPSNLHFNTEPTIIQLRDGHQVDVFCTYGFPKIHNFTCKWEDTVWHKYVHVDILYGLPESVLKQKPSNTSDVPVGAFPSFATPEDINRLHEIELKRIRDWETTPSVTKILVTHICPYEDPRFEGQSVTPHNIHLEKGYWIGSGTYISNINFLGARLYANPGRGKEVRARLFNI